MLLLNVDWYILHVLYKYSALTRHLLTHKNNTKALLSSSKVTWLWVSMTHVYSVTLMPKLWRSSSLFPSVPWSTWSCAAATLSPLTPMIPTPAWLPLLPFLITKTPSSSMARRPPTATTRRPATAVRTTVDRATAARPSMASLGPVAPLWRWPQTPLHNTATPVTWSPWHHPSRRNRS